MISKLILILLVIGASFGAGAYFRTPEPPPPCPITKDEPIVMQTPGGLLEVSTIKATERFSQTSNPEIFTIPLPWRVLTTIQVETTYRYHIELARNWKFIQRDNTFIVVAPAVKASIPVAIDTSTLRAEVQGNWLSITNPTFIQPLQKTITKELNRKAMIPEYIKLQRESARKTVTEFVSKWVLSQNQWKYGKHSIRVFFSDEPIEQIRANGYYPTPLNQ